MSLPCDLKYRGKKRSGESRWWCITHFAEVSSGNFMCPVSCGSEGKQINFEVLKLNLEDWDGGIGMWGAMEPVYSTHDAKESGVHVHARRKSGAKKDIDNTFDKVKLHDWANLFDENSYITIDQETALAYTASNIFGIPLKVLKCEKCNTYHSDEGHFAVSPHKKHLCTNCGHLFQDFEKGVSNPIVELRSRLASQMPYLPPVNSDKELIIEQKDFPGGIQIWGSNPAVLWSVNKAEEKGIHVHVYKDKDSDERIYDDTYGKVIIDGITLDQEQVRYLMVQQYLEDSISSVKAVYCEHCDEPHFDTGLHAKTPHSVHLCDNCEKEFQFKNSIGNPLVKDLDVLRRNYEALQK